MPAEPVRPIVIWLGRLGDTVILSALLEILHRRYGQPCTVISTGIWTQALYDGHPDVFETYSLKRHTPVLLDGGAWRAWQSLRRNRSGPVYVAECNRHRLPRVRQLLYLGGVARRRCLFITDALRNAPVHQVDRLIALGRMTPPAFAAHNYPWPHNPPPRMAPWLRVSESARQECDQWLVKRGWSDDRPLVLFYPGNFRIRRGHFVSEDPRAWPAERWAQVVARVRTEFPAARLLICGGPGESWLLQEIHALAAVAECSWAELALPLPMALYERAHSMITIDTGAGHVAAAVGLPIVVLFGASSQAEWAPRTAHGSAVLGVGGPPVSRHIQDVTVEEVVTAWKTLRQAMRAPQDRNRCDTGCSRASLG